MKRQLFLTPVDTFFFRNHMSLNAGEDSAASGLFPPRPGTVYGALRSAYIHEHSDFATFAKAGDEQVKQWMGTPSEVGEFQLQGVFLHTGTHMLLPLPCDYEIVSEDGAEWAYPLRLREEKTYGTGHGEWLLMSDRATKTTAPDQRFVVEMDAWKQTILTGERLPVQRLSQWVMSEPKIGIALNAKTSTVREHMLYEMDMQRLVGAEDPRYGSPSLCVLATQAPDFESIPVMSFGSEHRPWHLRQSAEETTWLTDADKAQLIKGIEQTGYARLILLTPTIWETSWDRERNTLTLEKKRHEKDSGEKLTVEICTMVMGRPQLIGGWDIQRNRPKPRSWAIAAGSVFYVKVPHDQAAAFVEITYLQNRSDELNHEGYGLLMPALLSVK